MSKRLLPYFVSLVFAFVLFASNLTAIAQSAHLSEVHPPSLKDSNYGQLPLSFEANQGQTDASTQFLSHGQGYTLLLRPGEAVLALYNPKAAAKPVKLATAQPGQPSAPAGESSLTSLKLIGANFKAGISGEDRQITRTNYFLGSDPTQWHTDIPNYGRVRYRSVYEGIDLVYYGNQRQLEHDFIVAPNADPVRIVLSLGGARNPRIDPATGDLIMIDGGKDQSSLRLLKPVAYQESKGRRIAVSSSYKLFSHRRIGFALGRYNHSQPLVIDPVLVYSTYLGGSGQTSTSGVDQGNGVVVDPDGNAYIVGSTQSADFPVTSGVYQPTNHGLANYPYRNAFVSKINATGTQLIFSTYFGSSDNGIENGYTSGDQGVAIALDSDRNVYIAGYTTSTDFPTTPGAFQTVNYNQLPGGARGPTAFAAKLNASGTQLEYSTLLGGHAPVNSALGDQAVALAVDSSKYAYVAGTTSSPDFPVSAGAFQTSTASQTAAFVTKLNLDGTGIVYSTFLGSPKDGTPAGQVSAAGLALDNFGNAYVAGTTTAYNYPTTAGAFQVKTYVLPGAGNAYLTKLNSSGSALVYSTYLGGLGEATPGGGGYTGDSAQAIALDSSGSAYVAGTAVSYNFPIQGGLMQPWDSGSGSGFLAKFNPSGTALDYSTRIGGDFSTVASLAVDGSGKAFVLGLANPPYFSITSDGSLQQKTSQSQPDGVFLAKVNTAGSALEYATMFGGTGSDTPGGIAVDAGGDAFLTGNTYSTDFPVTSGAVQSIDKGTASHSAQAFLSKLALAGETSDHFLTQLTLAVSAATVTQGTPITITATTTSAAAEAATGNIVFSAVPSSPKPFSATSVALDANGVATLTTSTLAPGNYTLYATYAGDGAHLSSNSSIRANGIVSFEVVGAPSHVVWQYGFGPAVYGEAPTGWDVAARVTDSVGDPVAGVPVTFSGTSLTFTQATVVTDANGSAAVVVTPHKVGTFLMYAAASGIKNPAIFQVVITPAPLTVTLQSNSRTYGAANPVFKYTVQGLIGSDTVTVTPQTTATLTSLPGTYPISATVSGPLATNYTATVVSGTLTVGKGQLSISASNVAVTYGQAPVAPTLYTLHGFVNGDTQASATTGAPVLTSTVTATTPVGFYPIGVQKGTLASANYYFVDAYSGEGSVGVYKAKLTVRPDNFTIHVGDPLPTFTYTITGFVNSDTQASATSGAPVLTSTAPSTAKPGRFYILGNQGTLTAPNYYFARPNAATNGILTIIP